MSPREIASDAVAAARAGQGAGGATDAGGATGAGGAGAAGAGGAAKIVAAGAAGTAGAAGGEAKIVAAKFLISAEFSTQAPRYELPCVALLGRSNVGKSSLINALCNHRGLAKSSATPGKTRLINFFEATFADKSRLVLIDLPGFGYARVSRSEREKWNKTLNRFLMDNPQICAFLHLLDARHDGLEIDAQSREYLLKISPNTAYTNVFTKADKLNQSERTRLLARNPGAFLVSSSKKTGLPKLLSYLHGLAR